MKMEKKVVKTILFEEGTVTDKGYFGTDVLLGFEYYEVKFDGTKHTLCNAMVRDYDIQRFPDKIRRHSTIMLLKDINIVGCSTEQEKYDWLIAKGCDMSLISLAYSGKIKFHK